MTTRSPRSWCRQSCSPQSRPTPGHVTGHRNAPLTPEGRLRLCLRIEAGRPIAHVAAEAGISRRCLGKWYARWRAHGEDGLHDRSSRPAASSARTAADVADLVEALRRQTKHGPARLAADIQRLHGITLAPATVHRVLVRRGLNRSRDLDPPTGERLREVIRYEHDQPGDMIHVDIKKLGRIPAGGGWRMHGLGTDVARASRRPAPALEKWATPTCIQPRMITRGWPTPRHWKTNVVPPRPRSGTAQRPSSPPTTSRPAASSRTTAHATARTRGLMPLQQPAPGTSAPALYTADQREGRTLQRHTPPGMGLRARLHLRA